MKAPRPALIGLFLAVMTLAVYWPVARQGFLAFDDDKYVTKNASVQAGLTWSGLKDDFTTPSPGGWPHPLALVSHRLDVQLYGLKAGGHHVTSLLLHVAAAILLFLALLKMTAAPWQSAFVAALFALHPLQLESVAWVAERKNVLNGAFVMLTLWAYADYARAPSRGRWAGVLAAFALACLSKSVVVSVPLLLLLLDFWPLRRREPWTRLAAEKLPMLAVSGLAALWALRAAQAVSGRISFSMRSANALLSCCAYLGKTLWPSRLSIFYPYPSVLSPWKTAGAALLLSAATAVAWKTRGRRPWLLVGWLWFLAALLPFIGLVQVGAQAMADRYMYLPLVGLASAFTWEAAARVGSETARTLGAGLLLCALMVLSGLELRYWQDGVSLFLRARQLHPESATIHDNLGAAFFEAGDVLDAIDEYREAVALQPDYTEALNNMAVALVVDGRYQEALDRLDDALKWEPASQRLLHNRARIVALAEARGVRPRPPLPSPRPRK